MNDERGQTSIEYALVLLLVVLVIVFVSAAGVLEIADALPSILDV